MWIMETPVPIPNTVVKHNPVDDTGPIRAGKVDQCYHLYRRDMSMQKRSLPVQERNRVQMYTFFEEFDPGSG